MAIAQYLLTSETSASFSVTVPATTAGNTLAIAVLFRSTSSGGAGTGSVTMSGASFTTQIEHSYGYNRGFIFTAPNISSGGITSFNFAGNGIPVVVFVTYVEISGVGSSPTITSNTNTGADTAPNVSVTAPSGDSDYVAFLGSSASTNPTLSGLTSGWSLTQTNGRGCGYKTATATGYQSLSGTLSASTNWHGGMVSITNSVTAKSDSDTASGTDASSALSVSTSNADTGSGTESGSVEITLDVSGSDDILGHDSHADGLAVDVSDTETPTTTETDFVGLDRSDTDVATATDAESPDRGTADADTSSGLEALAVFDRPGWETALAEDAVGDFAREVPDTASALDTESLVASITDADTASAVDVDYPIGISDAEASVSGADGILLLDYTYRFCPPAIQGYRDPEHPLFRRIPHLVGVGVLKIDGTYRQIECPDDEQFAAATEVYLGGHDTVVHEATAVALTAAGYGAYLTRF